MRAAQYPRMYAELRRLCDEHAVRVVTLRYPSLVQRLPPTDAAALAAYEGPLRDALGGERELPTLAAEAREQWLTTLEAVTAGSAQSGIEVLDVASRMEAELPASDTESTWAGYFRDHAHFTPAGDAALGKALAGILLERQLVTGTAPTAASRPLKRRSGGRPRARGRRRPASRPPSPA
jgi:hypothetical protein